MTPSKDRNYFKQEPRGEITAHSEPGTGDPFSPAEAEQVATLEQMPRGTSRYKLYLRRFFRNKLATLGLIILVFLMLAALFGGFFEIGRAHV